MTIFDLNTDADEWQPFRFSVEQRHIESGTAYPNEKPIALALQDFLGEYDKGVEVTQEADPLDSRNTYDSHAFYTYVKSDVFIMPEWHLYSECEKNIRKATNTR